MHWSKKFPKPHPEAIWCDECLRWETGMKRFERPPEPLGAKTFWGVARGIHKIAFLIHEVGDRFQIRANIRNGVFDARS